MKGDLRHARIAAELVISSFPVRTAASSVLYVCVQGNPFLGRKEGLFAMYVILLLPIPRAFSVVCE